MYQGKINELKNVPKNISHKKFRKKVFAKKSYFSLDVLDLENYKQSEIKSETKLF